MRYIIYGAGAVGGVIGARLFEHGYDVILIARGPHLDAIRDRGLKFETAEASKTLAINAVGHPSEIAWTPDDAVLLTMKTQHTSAALDDLRAFAGTTVPVVCAQNGVENERIASRRFARVYAMLVFLPACYIDPGVVQASASPVSGILDAGRYPRGVDSTIETISGDIDGSGLSAKPTSDIMRWKYAKLLSNLGNSIQAACDPQDDARSLHVRAREEAIACYKPAGIEWATPEEEAERRKSMSRMAPIAGAMRGGGSSWQSLARNTGSIETDYLNGEIALLGRLHNIPTPVNSALQRIAARLAAEGAAPGSLRLEEIEREIAAT